jgi:hypothetical protein
MIAEFGIDAWKMANERLQARSLAGDRSGAEFWAQVSSTIWTMGRESLARPPQREAAD